MSKNDLLDAKAVDEARSTFREKFATITRYFFEDGLAYIHAIREAIRAGNISAIVMPAHSLRSSGSQMGTPKVFELSKEIETAARENSNGSVWFAAKLVELEQAFTETQAAYPQD